ncbi:hypothetical protein PHAVU_011G057100 [Phaseolus vulgaris]|uniref:Uncharacterized protein n=1 Tax=Phaseolus vulgaris TaxID=3885 RepID=V7AEL7_PHAVU|nr:hypothetical protein PHAVU_011G057100g [Phaseolus vulgaris]ESW03979.1 hypothetical protein PHAVU_011G057100g [Phaseolus vulgaris]
MEKYLVSHRPPIEKVQRLPRHWKRSSVELNGRFERNYRHEMMDLLIRSYSEVGVFPHRYQVDGLPCQSHTNRLIGEANGSDYLPYRKQGISAVDFDNKGIYLVSVTKSGCLTVHDFETLYSQIPESTCLQEDESKHLMHLSLGRHLDAVKWNPLNQDEVVCASVKSNEVLIFDIGYVSSDPVAVLRTRRTAAFIGSTIHIGLSDVAFTSNDPRILACDTDGAINVWDRRVNSLPCLELRSASCGTLNSIQLNADNQIIFGAGKDGLVHVWDIRGGRASATFQSLKEVRHQPVKSVKLATLLKKIGSLEAQANIVPKEIHSININPSCPYQLAFHLNDGWSGVLDINNFEVTHIHCPPPAWLNDSYVPADLSYLRKPSWLSTCSIYLAGSPCGIHLLDFYPSTNSPSHVDYKEDVQEISKRNNRRNQNRFISLSEGIISCVAHPLYNAIVAGTKKTSLLVISQKQQSFRSED